MLVRSVGPTLFPQGKGTLKRTTSFGIYKDWCFTVDEFRDKTDKIVEKRFVVWNDFIQKIVCKKRNSKKGFDRYQ